MYLAAVVSNKAEDVVGLQSFSSSQSIRQLTYLSFYEITMFS